jgi:Ca2+-binding RTX toxin-like protein
VVFGGDGNDFIDGGLGSDQLHGRTGNDTIYGDKNMYIGPHGKGTSDYLAEQDAIFGDDGDDLICGRVVTWRMVAPVTTRST